MSEIISPSDLPEKTVDSVDPALLALMIDAVNATAARVAPCLVSTDPEPTADQLAEARLVLVAAVMRWSQVGVGGVVQESAGPFAITHDTSRTGGYNLWPSEINRLQEICTSGTGGKAFDIDTTPEDASRCGYWLHPDQWVPITP